MDGHEIMSSPAHGERLRKIRRLKIRNEKDDRPARDNVVQVIECQCRLGAASLRFKKQNLANEAQSVRSAFFRWNKKFDAIGEKYQPDLVVVTNSAESE